MLNKVKEDCSMWAPREGHSSSSSIFWLGLGFSQFSLWASRDGHSSSSSILWLCSGFSQCSLWASRDGHSSWFSKFSDSIRGSPNSSHRNIHPTCSSPHLQQNVDPTWQPAHTVNQRKMDHGSGSFRKIHRNNNHTDNLDWGQHTSEN